MESSSASDDSDSLSLFLSFSLSLSPMHTHTNTYWAHNADPHWEIKLNIQRLTVNRSAVRDAYGHMQGKRRSDNCGRCPWLRRTSRWTDVGAPGCYKPFQSFCSCQRGLRNTLESYWETEERSHGLKDLSVHFTCGSPGFNPQIYKGSLCTDGNNLWAYIAWSSPGAEQGEDSKPKPRANKSKHSKGISDVCSQLWSTLQWVDNKTEDIITFPSSLNRNKNIYYLLKAPVHMGPQGP